MTLVSPLKHQTSVCPFEPVRNLGEETHGKKEGKGARERKNRKRRKGGERGWYLSSWLKEIYPVISQNKSEFLRFFGLLIFIFYPYTIVFRFIIDRA